MVPVSLTRAEVNVATGREADIIRRDMIRRCRGYAVSIAEENGDLVARPPAGRPGLSRARRLARLTPRLPGADRLGEKHGEEQEQIEDRIGEQLARRALAGGAFAAPIDAERQRDEAAPAIAGHDAIDEPGEAEDRRREAGTAPGSRSRSGSRAASRGAGDHRQHRHAGRCVFVGLVERQRPEMRRRPQEDDGEEDEALPADVPVTAAQPITGGSAPAAPPMTMFCGVRRFSHIV